MERIEDFSDERHKAWCIHCGAVLNDTLTNRDHAPTKSLLNRPLPHHVPQVPVCASCNNGFSKDEAYLVCFFSCVLTGSTEPEAQVIAAASRLLESNPGLRARLDQARSTDAAGASVWVPETARLNRIIVKNARAHAFFELGEPLRDEPTDVVSVPLNAMSAELRHNFESVVWEVWPEVGSRLMTRLATGEGLVDGWIVVQPGIYRYAVLQDDGIVVRSVIRDHIAIETRWA
ncbi:hypothetical protein [Brevundimonas sp.]|uniref:hypothetical protein n=1 Tax=Brevundimonas sp. TaxID=1871086 RepID=UPI0024877BB9|nr:hypothetical protein [Brevundimonas sp.]MDI1282276.1 hypothetical protein [Brevundimonas sp.]